jgi:sec-independent protein translocase protein TatA
MGSLSIWHWLIVLAIVLILFGGGGKISKVMGDMAKGVKAFKKGLKDEEHEGGDGTAASTEPPKGISATSSAPSGTTSASADPVVRRDDSARR